MHGLDSSVPLSHTRIRGTRIVVTPKVVSAVLRVLRVKHPDYPKCDRLRTMSKDEMISAFYEHPSDQGDYQFTPCKAFAKGPRFINIVMTSVLHPLSHYNSIIEPHAQFLLSLLEHFTIDFPSHFILSLIDVYRDTTTHDKLIFPSAITQILYHFSVPFPSFDHFSIMCTIDATTIKCSEAQFRSRQTDSAAPPSLTAPSPSIPSTSAPSSSSNNVSLKDIMVQLQRMDARLDTLSIELYQVNVRVGRIAQQQATIGGFTPETSPPPPSVASNSKDEDDDDGDDDDSYDDDGGDVSSTAEMST